MIHCCYTDLSEQLIKLQRGINVYLPAVVSTVRSSFHIPYLSHYSPPSHFVYFHFAQYHSGKTVTLYHTISNANQSNSRKKTNATIITS